MGGRSELPVVPEKIKNTKYLVVFMNLEASIPFDAKHGEGWLVREYDSLDELVQLPEPSSQSSIKDVIINWCEVTNDAPSWDNAWELVDMQPISESERACEIFHQDYKNYDNTKFGGYPFCIQAEVPLDGFVFQIDTEDKAGVYWIDCGIAYFHKYDSGCWGFDCQFM